MSTAAKTKSSPKGKTAKPASSASGEKVKVTVDGHAVEISKTMPDPITGRPIPTTMIQACAAVRVEVPHYCYHPKLPVAGNCRMCLVEYGLPALGPDRKPVFNEDGSVKINRLPRPAIACATPISQGMEIYTQTPGVKQMREGVLEFLLINHPLDCPICDQAGECKLQEYSVEYGQSESRFVEEKVHKPKQVDLGPRIMLDDERCILCSRCIRFTRDVAGDDALGFVDRGGHSTLTHYPGKPFDNNYTLNTVDICPVGALTSKDFRFQMRVWFLKETKSLCTSCGTGCNTVIGSREDRVFRYEPRENDAVNSSWMCDSGRLNYKWIHDPDRLTGVRHRVTRDSGQVDTTWSAALNGVADRLRQVEKGTTAIIASARQTNEELYLLSQLAAFLDAVTDSVPRIGDADHLLVSADKNPNSNGALLIGVAVEEMGDRLPGIAEDIRAGKIRNLIVFGEDVTRFGIDPTLLEQLDLLVVSDIIANETTRLADWLLPGCAHAEKRGTFVNVKGRLQRFWQAIHPRGDARPEWETLHELMVKLTGPTAYSSIEGLFNQMAVEVPAFEGLSWAELGDAGVDVELPDAGPARRRAPEKDA